MYRSVLSCAVAAALACGQAAFAANDGDYYTFPQQAGWQATGSADHLVSPRDHLVSPHEPVVVAAVSDDPEPQADNEYLDAFVGGKPEAMLPVEIDGDKDDYGCIDYGKGSKSKGGYCWCPCWTITADGVVLRREHMDTVPLVVGPGPVTLLDADDIGLSHRAGIRLSAARQLGACNDIEVEFFALDGWSAVGTVPAPASFVVGGVPLPGVGPINLAYGTDLYSTEINWRRNLGGSGLKTLIGFRWIELSESMVVADAASPPDLFVGDVDNHLFGVQLGVEGILWERNRWQIEGGTKLGIYGNVADFTADLPGVPATFAGNEDHTAFAAELVLGVNYCLTDCIALRAGYQAMWIEGVAILPEQLDDPAFFALGDLDMGGSPFYHGFYLGAQASW